ncbi:MAG: LysM peptidoglycan-binding domain-containing protein [Clostridia bacterium]|nr:LysM peptidoglycan-binding domain-containing protein [Clostridia bacterium]
MKKAIDVSSYQGTIDWDAVKADGVEFAVIRGGFGDDLYRQDDGQFERNWAECQRVGIPCTMYFFSYGAAKGGDITGEINHIHRLMRGKRMNCDAPIYIDVENTSGLNWRSISDEALLDMMRRYKAGLEKLGYKMGIYSSRSAFWNEKMTDPWYQENVSIWVAEYGKAVTHFDRHYDLWQYSASGSVQGIKGRVDMDWLYADFTKPAPAPAPDPAPSPAPTPEPAPAPSEQVYTVAKGDTLSGIAAKYGTTYQKLAAYNGIANPNLIHPGQKIRIPGTGTPVPAPAPSPAPAEKVYTVVKGDTLSGIAKKYGTTYQKLAAYNGIQNPNLIHPGQKIRIP